MALINQLGYEIPDRWIYPAAGEHGSFAAFHVGSVDIIERLDAAPVCGRPTGVLLNSESPLGVVAELLERIDLIVVPFAKLRDGRGFTLARALRGQHGYMGDVRAIGDLLPDQLQLLVQCGFTSIVLPPNHPASQWRPAQLPTSGAAVQPKPLLQRLVRRSQ
ncbi:hypothetical protein AS026_30270 [Rhizobium altiplani]|uniref:Oxidoreductase n=1 Tax=Rhizobium altiplani TaxID=1864509 RepID=A0A109K0F7_9HYPH|nr:DUF934 domain-containing protein [Rhizobium altiplani]KWV58478.1 hypothetical protein AS026_30270 [Rhizobium altiplani]